MWPSPAGEVNNTFLPMRAILPFALTKQGYAMRAVRADHPAAGVTDDPGRACPRLRLAQLGMLSVRHSAISAQQGCARTGTKGPTSCAADDHLGPSVKRPLFPSSPNGNGL